MSNNDKDLEFLNQPLEPSKDALDINLKVKPKINIGKLIKEKELEIKSIDLNMKIHADIDDVTFIDAKSNADAKGLFNGKDNSLRSAELKMTKKF